MKPTTDKPPATAMNRFEQARQRHQFEMLSRSTELQEEAIADHYVAFSHLDTQLRTLVNQRKQSRSEESDDLTSILGWEDQARSFDGVWNSTGMADLWSGWKGKR